MDAANKHAHIKGWGSDLDHADRPAYPMERMPARLEGVHWHEPAQQPQTVEILHSTERPGITPVFGTSTPPSGLSGMLRRFAFRYSENDLRHWLVLLFADRVNVGEGIVADLAAGKIPNIYAEMGGRAELNTTRRGPRKKRACWRERWGSRTCCCARSAVPPRRSPWLIAAVDPFPGGRRRPPLGGPPPGARRRRGPRVHGANSSTVWN